MAFFGFQYGEHCPPATDQGQGIGCFEKVSGESHRLSLQSRGQRCFLSVFLYFDVTQLFITCKY